MVEPYKFGNITSHGSLTPASMRKLLYKQVSHRQVFGMSMNESLHPFGKFGARRTQVTQASQTAQPTQTNSYSSLTDAMGVLNKSFGALTKNGSTNTSSSNISTNTPAKMSQPSGGGGNVSGISDNGASFSGYAQSMTVNKGFDTSNVDSIVNSLDNPNLSSKDLIAMQNELSSQAVSVNSALSSAQADFSNIRSQQLTAESNVQRLESAVSNAEVEKNNAKTGLDDSTSNLNSSINTRDALDEQLSSVNEEY